ncbi:MAG: hypothetical protein AAF541_17125 [Pseudomonadota bacterium]
MKIDPKIAAIALLLTATAAHAGPNKGQMYAQCKQQTKAEFGEKARVKLKRMHGSKMHLRVSPEGGETTTIVCSRDGKEVRLAYRDGRELSYMSKID